MCCLLVAGFQAYLYGQCDFEPGMPIILNAQALTTTGYTNNYILTSATGQILDIQSQPNFPMGVATAQKVAVYGLHYETATGIMGLTIGQNISGITGSCFSLSQAMELYICGYPCLFDSSEPVQFNATGGNALSGYSTLYLLTTISGSILDTSTTNQFGPQAIGFYRIHSINYRTVDGITGVIVGNNINAIINTCSDNAKPLNFKVCNSSCDFYNTDTIRFTGIATNTSANYTTLYILEQELRNVGEFLQQQRTSRKPSHITTYYLIVSLKQHLVTVGYKQRYAG